MTRYLIALVTALGFAAQSHAQYVYLDAAGQGQGVHVAVGTGGRPGLLPRLRGLIGGGIVGGCNCTAAQAIYTLPVQTYIQPPVMQTFQPPPVAESYVEYQRIPVTRTVVDHVPVSRQITEYQTQAITKQRLVYPPAQAVPGYCPPGMLPQAAPVYPPQAYPQQPPAAPMYEPVPGPMKQPARDRDREMEEMQLRIDALQAELQRSREPIPKAPKK